MTDRVNPVPEGFHTVTPYLICGDAAGAIEFYKEVFGATELMRQSHTDGKIQHAEIRIGDSPIMIADESPDFPKMRGPLALGGSSLIVFLYVKDVDAIVDQAVAAGAKVLDPVEDHPAEGDRRGGFEDPFGFVWGVATHIEDVSREEIQTRLEHSKE